MRGSWIVWFFFSLLSQAQSGVIKGRVQIDAPHISGILVVNLTQETETKTSGEGTFQVKANVDDLLIFSADHIYKKRYIVKESDFTKVLIIELEAKPIEIEQVVIEDSPINSESLGLVPKGQKRYTVAERRLFTSQSDRGIGTIVDLISGRKRMLKNLQAMEHEDKMVKEIGFKFNEAYFVENLELREEWVEEFKYYVVAHLKENLKPKKGVNYIRPISKSEMELVFLQLAPEYIRVKKQIENK